MSVAVYILSTVTGYMLTSALLLKCPGLLHRRRKETFISRHISHRGGQSVSFDSVGQKSTFWPWHFVRVARMIPWVQTQISYEITEHILLESDCSTIDEIQSNLWILLKILGSEYTTQHVLPGKSAHPCDIKLITRSLKAKLTTPQRKRWIPAACMTDPILLVTTHSSRMQVHPIPVKPLDAFRINYGLV